MKNALVERIASALGIHKAQPELGMTGSAGLLLPVGSPVVKALLPALKESNLSVPLRCAIIAAPPLSVDGVAERINHASKIEGMCYAAAKTSGHDLLNRLAVGYVMAGASPEHVKRDLTDFLVDIEGTALTTTHPEPSQGKWDNAIQRAKASQANSAKVVHSNQVSEGAD